MDQRSQPKPFTDRAFLSICLATAAHFTIIGSLAPVLPRYVIGPIGGSPGSVGIVYGSLGVVAMLLRPQAGRYSDDKGRRPLLLGGILTLGGSVAAYAVATNLPVLMSLRAVSGLGVACFMTAATASIYDLAPTHRRAESLSYFSLALYGGLAVGPVLGELMWENGGFGAVWLTGSGLAIIAALAVVRIPESRLESFSDNQLGIVQRTGIVHRAGFGPGLILFAALFGQGGLQAIGTLYSVEVGMSESRVIFVVFAVTLLLIRSFGARLPDRIGHRRSAAGALALSALGLGLFATFATSGGLLTATVVFACGQALAYPAILSMSASRVPAAERGALVGTVTAFLDLALAIGGIAMAQIADGSGFRAAFLTAAGVSLLGFLALVKSRKVSRRPR